MGDSQIEKRAAAAIADPASHPAVVDVATWVLRAAEALRLARIALQPCKCPRTRFGHIPRPRLPCASCRTATAIDDLLAKEPA